LPTLLVVRLSLECTLELDRAPKPVWAFKEFSNLVPSFGWLRDYLAYGIACTDAPPLYHIIAGLAGIALAISPDHVMMVNGEEHPLHMFFLMVGESGNRKSAALKRALRVIQPCLAAQQLAHRIWYPEASSSEGIIDELAIDPNRIMVASEWTEFHSQGHASYAKHSRELMNLLYDGSALHRIKANGKSVIVEKTCVTILGASTPSLVKQATTLHDWSAGKLARYVIGYMGKPDDREMVSAIEQPRMVDDLRLGYDRLLSKSHGRAFVLDQAAWDCKVDWEHSDDWVQFRRSLPEHLQPSALRVGEHLYRIAALFQASIDYPHNTVVGTEAMVKAIQFMWACCIGLLSTFAILPSGEANSMARVLQVLHMYGSEGVSRRDLLRQTHLTGRQLTEAIGVLKEREDVIETCIDRRWHYCHQIR
jgi:hypothetical protein